MKPFARISRLSEGYEDAAFREEVDAAAGSRRRSTRKANLGTFTGYRIGFDIGNGNIGWCILFEDGRRLHFLTAQDIADHNRKLPKSGRRTQLPDLSGFVSMGTHKFDARESQKKGDKSFSKIRADARASRHMLDARQRRRLHVKKALQDAGLLPKEGEEIKGQVTTKADVLRAKLLDPSFPVHPHDLGRALYNALKRRGYLKPVGRAGPDEGSGFATKTEEAYRQALKQYSSRTIGEFLEHCASDARRNKVPFRKRHSSLAWQKENRTKRPKDGDNAPSYEAFRFLTPTFSLIREECEILREASGVEIDDEAWARIEEAAEFRRPLQAKTPGQCRYFPDEYRCGAALPSFQRFRSLEQTANLRDQRGLPLDKTTFDRVLDILETWEAISLNELSRTLGVELKLDRGDRSGARRLIGAKTDIALGEAFGEAWLRLPVDQRDDWIMRFLRRHWPPAKGEKFPPWNKSDTEALEREAEAAFGDGALARVDHVDVAKKLEDRFSSMSVKAARLLGDCYEQRLDHGEQLRKLREHGAPEPELALYERLPYYGEVMPDETVPAAGFAPEERTAAEERQDGRAANPDVHVVLNRLRAVVNAIIEMMGGILPTRCAIEMARSTFSETQAAAHNRTNRDREKLRRSIEGEIGKVLGATMPVGPSLDRLVDRWKAAIRQGWRDYDGSEIPRSALVDGSEYQLDHVEPAAFGDFRENNIFVSRFNQQKGRCLPWEAFGEDPQFQPALVAFTTFGLRSQIEVSEKRLSKLSRSSPRRDRLETTLTRAQHSLDRLAEFGEPRPDVLKALERTLTVEGAQPFRPGDKVDGGLGAFGKENIYSFRPTWNEREELTKLLRKEGLVPNDGFVLSGKEILACYGEIPRNTPKGKRLADKLAGKIELGYRNRDKDKSTALKLRTALSLSGQKGAFINAESKFAVVGAPRARERRIISTAEFARMDTAERTGIFTTGQPVYRRGDTLIQDREAFVVTGMNIEKRLIVYPVDEAGREGNNRKLITPGENGAKFTSDVLGRRLHRRGKDTGGLQPVPYPLRDK